MGNVTVSVVLDPNALQSLITMALVVLIITQVVPYKFFSLVTVALIEILVKITRIINLLASLNWTMKSTHLRRMLNTLTALSALVTPSICCRCMIKGRYFCEVPHFCKKFLPDNTYKYCILQHTVCEPVCDLSHPTILANVVRFWEAYETRQRNSLCSLQRPRKPLWWMEISPFLMQLLSEGKNFKKF